MSRFIEFLVDTDTGFALCSACSKGHKAEPRLAECWPTELAAYYADHGVSGKLAPPHNPECARLQAGKPPGITSPSNGQKYLLTENVNGAEQKILFSAKGCGRLFWFVDGELFADAATGERIFWPAKIGRHKIICVDDSGQAVGADITVVNP